MENHLCNKLVVMKVILTRLGSLVRIQSEVKIVMYKVMDYLHLLE